MNVKPQRPTARRTEVRQVVVGHREAGMRLDRLLKDNLPDAPLSLLQKLLRTGQVRVDGSRKKGNYRLLQGERVRIPPVRLEPQPGHGRGEHGRRCPPKVVADIGKRILYRDSSLLVIDKPAAMAVHGGSGRSWGVVDAVREYLHAESEGDAVVSPELCHRLDRDTSGCLLFGLDKYSTRTLTAAFRDGKVDKGYLALVKGRPEPAQGVIDKALQKGVVRSGERMVVTDAATGRTARTRYRSERKFADATLMDVALETGRTHQIRVHFQSIGHPLALDGKYGDRLFNRQMKGLGLKRLFLHARRLRFKHPDSGRLVETVAPLDVELKHFLDLLP